MNTPLLRRIYVFSTGLLLCTSIGSFSQAAAKRALIATDGQALLAQASRQRSNPFPPEVLQWQRQVKTLTQQGNYQEAVRIQEKELAWAEQHLGPDHPDSATSLHNLAALYVRKGSYAKALPLYLRTLAFREKALGSNHPDTANTLNSIALLYAKHGHHDQYKAEPLYIRALAIREKALGADHPDTAVSLSNLAELYEGKLSYTKAEPLYLRALKINEKALGLNHPTTVSILEALGELYSEKLRNLHKAERLYLHALAISEKTRGTNHPDTVRWLVRFADMYRRRGFYTKAEPLYLRALKINEKALGQNHPTNVIIHNSLGMIYKNLGDFAIAEPHFTRSLAIVEKKLGPSDDDFISDLIQLADSYILHGAYAKAEQLYLRQLAIIERGRGADHPDNVRWLLRLANMYNMQGALTKAEPLFYRAISITEKELGADNRDYAFLLIDLAKLYNRQGAFAKAMPLYIRSLAILEKVVEPSHDEFISSLDLLSHLDILQNADANNEILYTKVESLYIRALTISERWGSSDVGSRIRDKLVQLYKNYRDYAKIEALYQRILATIVKVEYPQTLYTAADAILMELATIYQSQGAFSKIEALYLRNLATIEKASGSDSEYTAHALMGLASTYKNQGAYAKSESLVMRAQSIYMKRREGKVPDSAFFGQRLVSSAIKPEDDPLGEGEDDGLLPGDKKVKTPINFLEESFIRSRVRTTSSDINHLINRQGGNINIFQCPYDTTEAETILVNNKRKLGSNSPAFAGVLSSIAMNYACKSAYAKAEALFLQALAILEKELGPSDPETINSLNNLAAFYGQQGVYSKAELLYQRALSITEKARGPDDFATAISLLNLSNLHISKGAFPRAEPLLLRALAITEQSRGPEHLDTADILTYLAELYREQGAYPKAEPLFLRALAITEKALGPDHPRTALSLSSLAAVYHSQGAYAKAEPLYIRALAIREKAIGPDHPLTTNLLYILADLYDSQGASAKAEPLYLRLLAIDEKTLWPEHPDRAILLNNIAVRYFRKGDYAKAEPLLRRGIATQSLFLQRQLPLMAQAARQAQVQALDSSWEMAFTGVEQSSSAADLALFARLNRYGLLLEIEKRQAQLGRAPSAPRKLSEEIAALTTKLADASTPAAQRRELQNRKAELEREYYLRLPALKPQLVEPAQVARVLPAGAVLVEFQRYRLFDGRQKPGKQWGAPHYVALVLNAAGTTQAVELGPAPRIDGIDGIDTLIAKALAVSQASGGDPTELWKQVNSKVFPARLLQLLAGANQWILAPDGELSRIPFAALPSPRDPQLRLTDSVAVRLISSGRTLLPQTSSTTNAPTRPLVLSDPDYGPAPPNTDGWPPLPATAEEGRKISQLLQADLYEQAAATTAVLTRAKDPRLVHVASHGYYAGAPELPTQAASPSAAAGATGGMRSAIAGLPASREDAMLNSGIVLAGANRSLRPDRAPAAPSAGSNNSADDGYLTAKEAAQLQLEGTQLVVLSACDTASGEQQSGEGLFGLQRALSVAGARTTLLSLWKVDDEATSYFMQRYYTLLKQGKGRMEALLAVQKEFRDKPPRTEWEDYRYWAAWQLVGESGPMPGI